MMSLKIDPTTDPAKILLIGESGAGKTGAKAALIALGFKLRGIDTDKGSRILKSLLTSDKYPYAAYMKKHDITPDYQYVPFDLPMGIVEVETYKSGKRVKEWIPGPTSGRTFNDIFKQLQDWKFGGKSYGNVANWEPDTILDIDTLSTLSYMAKAYSQELNNHLGALADEHGRDTGAAQELVLRLLMTLASSSVKCNVIVTTHIARVDTTQGAAVSPGQLLRDHKPVDPKGYPAAIGRALSLQIGKLFNDTFIVREAGGGLNTRREISTIPADNTSAKNSVWLEPSYPVSTGLAEIFSALLYLDPPTDFIKSIRGSATENTTSSVSASVTSNPWAKAAR